MPWGLGARISGTPPRSAISISRIPTAIISSPQQIPETEISFGNKVFEQAAGRQRRIRVITVKRNSEQTFRCFLHSDEDPSFTITLNHEPEAGDALNRILRTTLCEQLHNIHLSLRFPGQLKTCKQRFDGPALIEFLRSEPIPEVGQFLYKCLGRRGLLCCLQSSLEEFPERFENCGWNLIADRK